MLDELAVNNRARWNALVEANIQYSRPILDFTVDSARNFIDPSGILGDVQGKQVLCLASGGGQQSAAFALLGAEVTVLDLSDKQLESDRLAANHYGVNIRTVHGDMRQLDALATDSFDAVFQGYSINFVPSIAPVFAEVARVCRPGAFYYLDWANPFVRLVDSDKDWNGDGYLLRHEYVDGRDVTKIMPTWTVDQDDGSVKTLEGPHEFIHSFATIVNTLAANRFVILRAGEYMGAGREGPPGSWFHFAHVVVPYLSFWTRYLPQIFSL